MRQESLEKGIGIKIDEAEDAIKTGAYDDALGPLNTAEKFATAAGVPVPGEIAKLRKKAYKIGVDAKLDDVNNNLKDGAYADAVDALPPQPGGNRGSTSIRNLNCRARHAGARGHRRCAGPADLGLAPGATGTRCGQRPCSTVGGDCELCPRIDGAR